MEKKIKIFDIELARISSKEAMKRAMTYMEGDSVSTLEIVTMEMLMNGQENAEWKEQLLSMDLLLPGDREILESTETADWRSIRDVEDKVFARLFFRYLERNKKRIFLLAENEEDLEHLKELLAKSRLQQLIAGEAVLSRESGGEENVINEINGEEPDCILSILPSPWQEEFIVKQKALLNARLWFGCEQILKWGNLKQKKSGKLKHFFLKKRFRHQVEKEKKE